MSKEECIFGNMEKTTLICLLITAYFGYCFAIIGGKDAIIFKTQQDESAESPGDEGVYSEGEFAPT